MGKNKKKSAKKQHQTAPENANSKGQKADEHQAEHVQSSRDIKDQSLETSSQEAKDASNGDGTAAAPVSSNEEMDRLREEIQALKSELALERELRQTQKDGNVAVPSPFTDSQEYNDLKAERDEFEAQYNNLLNRISSMKNVFSKMKESQQELEAVKEQLSEYESQNVRLKEKVDILNKERKDLEETITTLNLEYSNLDEERESAQRRCTSYKNELESLAERLERESEKHRQELKSIVDEKNQLDSQLQDMVIVLKSSRQDLSTLRAEKEDLSSAVKTLEEEKKTLQENIRSLEADLENAFGSFKQQSKQNTLEVNALRSQLDKSEESNAQLSKTIEQLNKDIQSMSEDVSGKKKLEQECKERVLQIGKLRHEAIILNEHLTKALTMLKQSSDSESVDKELISNLLVSFVSIPRADPKKFEVLELISSFLSWDDDKKRQAGLLHYKEQTPKSAGSMSSTGNFVTLWTEFLEKESEK
ncbi:hypothetical protein HG536_0A07370 [Torulaspora globosa]|uniref:GRIP domain-containing protein n=1 Tax=Torulaspora globosa TaxID=48254 RepID=A0A7G3ZBN6_9SACH|nr:uncharacterized protein HG536_0A07370 [Torulaspora globosa]QLL30922.1 hypothetical protein HG536_0A07370 [Torulaspora globosa]